MLISNTRKKKLNLLLLLRISISSAITILAFIFFIYPIYLKISTTKDKTIIHCDAERTYRKSFISNGQRFNGSHTQSKDFAHTGTYSSLLPKSDQPQYGFSYTFLNPKPGTIYQASVWVKKEKATKAFLVFAGEKHSGFYEASETLGAVENGFEKLSISVRIPEHLSPNTAKVYVYTDGTDKVYFDDLKIMETDSIKIADSYAFEPPHLKLQMKEKSYQKLESKIKTAQEKGVLITDEDSWVTASLNLGEQKIPIKTRLKGDWLDHVENDKWSFRIKTKDANTWNRMTTFSIHTPAARFYALEWLLHQFWENENVLTTRYDFINLSLNGKYLGTYAYEEHFEKQLLEYRKRREGPIIRFSEEALWDIRSKQLKTNTSGKTIRAEEAQQSSSAIKPFKASKILESETLTQQYNIAKNLLHQYQEGLKTAEEIFDMEQLAKYHAIIDLFGSHHALVWHNQRFYYNPVTSLLEPIGYDGFATEPWAEPLILGKEQVEIVGPYDETPLKRLLDNEVFLEKYMQYLNQYTEEDFLKSFFNKTAKGMQARIDFLKTEFPSIKFDPERILERARKIRFRIYPFQKHSVKANWTKTAENSKVLKVSSSHELPLQVIGTGSSPIKATSSLEQKTTLPGFRLGNQKVIKEIIAPSTAKYIFYKPYGIDTLFSSPIGLFPLTSGEVPRQTLFENINLVSNKIYELKENKVFFKSGNHQTSKDIIIPADYQVVFQAGCNLDLTNRAKFISKSPVFLNGTSEAPIQIYSSDKSANGFTILQSPETSNISFTTFSDLNTLNFKGWNLTGAVTFYESDVQINQVKIINNHCEDALNIIRSTFDIKSLNLVNPAFDGFDADFCKGRIDNSTIENAGNDGIDFSGSEVFISACRIIQAGDKGISVGEESRITVDNTTVDGAAIGVASKDLSYLQIKKIMLKDCKQGFTAYQKKPEYGRSTIFVESYDAENVSRLHTIAPRCTLKIDGYFVIGK